MKIQSISLSILISLGIPSISSAATFIEFDDRASFEAALNSFSLVDFNSFASDVNLTPTPLDVGPFSISADTSNTDYRIESDGSDVVNIDGTAFVRGVDEPNSSLTFTFDAPIFAFGADLSDVNNQVERSRLEILGTEFSYPIVNQGPPITRSFFGVISDTAFTTASFNALTAGEEAGIDNVTFSADIAAVPLPAAGLLLFFGVASMAGLQRRSLGKSQSI